MGPNRVRAISAKELTMDEFQFRKMLRNGDLIIKYTTLGGKVTESASECPTPRFGPPSAQFEQRAPGVTTGRWAQVKVAALHVGKGFASVLKWSVGLSAAILGTALAGLVGFMVGMTLCCDDQESFDRIMEVSMAVGKFPYTMFDWCERQCAACLAAMPARLPAE